MRKIILLLAMILSVNTAFADEDENDQKRQTAKAATDASELDKILKNPDAYGLTNVQPITVAKNIIDRIAEQKKIDVDRVHSFSEATITLISDFMVKVLDRKISLSELTNNGYKSDPEKMAMLERMLVERNIASSNDAGRLSLAMNQLMQFRDELLDLHSLSYTSRLHNNAKVSSDLQRDIVSLTAKLPNILAQQKNITDWEVSTALVTFKTIAKQFKSTNRFLPAIGYSFSYTPQIFLTSFSNIDISDFEPTHFSRAALFKNTVEFDNKSYSSLSVHAKIDYLSVNLSFPQLSETLANTYSVEELTDSSIEGQVLSRSSTKTEIKFDYDVSITLSIKDSVFALSGWKILPNQYDVGVGYGLMGINVKEDITHDIRTRADNTPYKDLPSLTTLNVKQDKDFLVSYASVYFDASPTDSITAGAILRRYFDESSSEYELRTDDYSVSLYVRWYPQDYLDWF